MDTQEQELRRLDEEYIALLRKGYGLCSEIIDHLVDMFYLAAADDEFLTAEVVEWLDGLQENARDVVEGLAAEDAEE